MKKVAIIPARYQSSRFPGKPLALILEKPMIQWVYENVSRTIGLADAYVATDNQSIYDCVTAFGGKALMTAADHICGTDRLAECIDILSLENDDIILNIQGDEPLIKEKMIMDLAGIFDDESVYAGTLKKRIENEEELNNPNVVKVVCDTNNDAIYFSRYPIPFERDGIKRTHYKHIGVYAYKAGFLKEFSKMNKMELELSESLEQLRIIENGYKIRVKETRWETIGVDSPQQISLVERYLQEVEGYKL